MLKRILFSKALRSPAKYITVILIFSTATSLTDQASFTINYHFRLFGEDGKVISGKDRLTNRICIDPSGGSITEFRFDNHTKYFSVKIHTIQPVFAITWKHRNKEMRIALNYATGYKEIYLDSLSFIPADFLIKGDLKEYVCAEDANSRHLEFKDISMYRHNSAAGMNKILRGNIRCW